MRRGPKRDHASRTVARALDLVEAYAPRQIKLMRREFAAVLVYDCGPILALGQFNPRLCLCSLDAGYFDVRRTVLSEAIIAASTLIHEAVHARLARYGYAGDRLRGNRVTLQRVERLCVKAELDFVSQLPGSEALQTRYRDRLNDIAEAYSAEAERAERCRALRELLRLLGVPVRPAERAVRSDRPAA